MLLDAVISHPELDWLATAADKVRPKFAMPAADATSRGSTEFMLIVVNGTMNIATPMP